MTFYISIISHGHTRIISDLGCLAKLALEPCIKVIVKDNIQDPQLQEYCRAHLLYYISDSPGSGFGKNNNIVFEWCEGQFGFSTEDYFLVLNPDVAVEAQAIFNLAKEAEKRDARISTLNLFKDHSFMTYDPAVRHYPRLSNYLSALLGMGNAAIIDKDTLQEPIWADWASGSFLLFKPSLYLELGGFDESYFMYVEDVDICWRADKIFNEKLLYVPQVKAVHLAQHQNKKIFSRHFFWFGKSIIRFLLTKHGFRNMAVQIR